MAIIVQTEHSNKGEYIPQRFNFSTDLLVSQYLESCFVMEISDEADDSDHLFYKARTEHWGPGQASISVIHPWLQASYSESKAGGALDWQD